MGVIAKKSLKKILVPFYLLKYSTIYLWWCISIIFFGMINVWAYIFLIRFNDIIVSMKGGVVYTFAISICAPFIVSFGLDWIDKARKGEKPQFMAFKTTTMFLNIIWIFILTFIWLGELKSSVIVQVIVGIISVGLSFYMFCINEMQNHNEIFGPYDDTQYLNQEKVSMTNIEDKAKTINSQEIIEWRKK